VLSIQAIERLRLSSIRNAESDKLKKSVIDISILVLFAAILWMLPSITFAAGKEEMQQLLGKIQAAYNERAQLLEHSQGSVSAEFIYDSPSSSFTESNPGKSFIPRAGKWNTGWFQNGVKYRYDTEGDFDENNPQPDSVFTVKKSIRKACDGESSLAYNLPTNTATLAKPFRRYGNPFGLESTFRIDYCYDGNFPSRSESDKTLHRDYATLLQNLIEHPDKSNVQITEEECKGLKCEKVTSIATWSDSPRRSQLYLWFAPSMGYSLLRYEHYSNADHLEDASPQMELRRSYDAEYEESTTHHGVWLLKQLAMTQNESTVGSEQLTLKFSDVKIGVDIPDETFTFEGLGVPTGAKIYDSRVDEANPILSYYKQFPESEINTIITDLHANITKANTETPPSTSNTDAISTKTTLPSRHFLSYSMMIILAFCLAMGLFIAVVRKRRRK
jgi:hypothetical protein